MNKAMTVAAHEFRTTVRRPWFIVITIGFPIFMAAITGLSAWSNISAAKSISEKVASAPFGIVDYGGAFEQDMKRPSALRFFHGEHEAQAAIKRGEIDSYLVIPEYYLSEGTIALYTSISPSILVRHQDLFPQGFREWFLSVLLSDVDARRAERVQSPFAKMRTITLKPTGEISDESVEKRLHRLFVAIGCFFLLFLSIATCSGYLLHGMAEEKANRVSEILLAAVTPGDLMIGKLIGLGGAGLLQVIIWSLMGIGAMLLLTVGVAIEPATLLFCLIFFVLGYLLYGALMLGFGSLGTNFRESQQIASIWSIVSILPLLFFTSIVSDPQSTTARVFSLIPFTSPTAMMLRYASDPAGTPLVEVALALAILIAAIAAVLFLCARLYRVGLLLYGKRPTPREVWRLLMRG